MFSLGNNDLSLVIIQFIMQDSLGKNSETCNKEKCNDAQKNRMIGIRKDLSNWECWVSQNFYKNQSIITKSWMCMKSRPWR